MFKYLSLLLGFLFVGIGFVGVIIPGLPTVTFMIIAAWFFAQSSPRFRQWILDHPMFGKHVTNWYERQIFPRIAKIGMVASMTLSLSVTGYFTGNLYLVLGIGSFMAAVVIWALRYPNNEEQYNDRKDKGEKIGWFK
tara:strand:+ start:254 stop:664 length:411 start_codon:yes stop_codon:yes gene_type:complete